MSSSDRELYFKSWSEFHYDTKCLARLILGEKKNWKGIVAITRGGLVPAAILARELDIHLVETLCISTYTGSTMGQSEVLKLPEVACKTGGKDWLLVDDLSDTGTTLKIGKKLLPKALVVTTYVKPSGEDQVDIYHQSFPQESWVRFPWDTEIQFVAPLVESKKK